MSAISKIISHWTYHANGGYYTKEILDGDLLAEARKELDAVKEIYRLASLPGDGNEPKEGESDDPMSLLLRIAELAGELL